MTTQTEALTLALEALERSAYYGVDAKIEAVKAIKAIKEALQSNEQVEPVAWRSPNWGHSMDEWVYRDADDPVLTANGKPSPSNEPLYTHPPVPTAQQENDAVETLTEEGWIWDGDQWQRPLVPTAQPKEPEQE